jgi:quercetin dioxygenase-like cupin family protein
MRVQRATILKTCLGKAQNLSELIEYSEDSIVSKTIMDKPAGTITLFAFDKGQRLSEHTSPFDAIVQVLEGQAEVKIKGERQQVLSGQLIIMPANVSHEVAAKDRFKMLLIMIRECTKVI